jgi:hypothetical protein
MREKDTRNGRNMATMVFQSRIRALIWRYGKDVSNRTIGMRVTLAKNEAVKMEKPLRSCPNDFPR